MAEEVTPKLPKGTKQEFIFAIGRRREAVARVRLYIGKESVAWGEVVAKKGEILVNGKTAKDYFRTSLAETIYLEPLRVTNALNRAIVTIRVVGGGPNGQLEAAVHGISRALSLFDVKLNRPILKKRGFLTRDARVRERRKAGMGGKARRKRQSPKR